ncbi:MAG: YidB family protein [Caulobacteraceae bacterium]
MGLFDNLGGLVQGALGQQGEGEQAQGAMGIVGSLLQQGGGQGQSSNIVGALLGGQGGAGQGGAGGGMAGMLEALAANGLADHVGSWLGGANNLPVSPQQIHDALGSDQVQQMASASGLPVGDFLKHLADHLPQAASEASGTADGSGDSDDNS